MLDTNILQVPIAELPLSLETLYRYMGYHGDAVPKEEVLTMCRRLIDEVMGIGHPQFGYRIVLGEALGNSSFEWGSVRFKPGCTITRALKGCSKYVFLTVTVGLEVDKWIKKMNTAGDIMKIYIADIIGSALAELTSAYACNYIDGEARKEGLLTTNSYSPGYCDWMVKEQHLFFSLLPPDFCGIHLSDSCLMSPIKSVSCVIGLGPDAVKSPYRCDICLRKDCFLKIARKKEMR